MNRLVRVQQKDRQQGPLLRAAYIGGMPVYRDLERPQKAIFKHTPTPQHSQARPGTGGQCWRAVLPPAM